MCTVYCLKSVQRRQLRSIAIVIGTNLEEDYVLEDKGEDEYLEHDFSNVKNVEIIL